MRKRERKKEEARKQGRKEGRKKGKEREARSLKYKSMGRVIRH